MKMKKLILALLIVVAGLGFGGAAAFGTLMLFPPEQAARDGDRIFVPVNRLLAPLVDKEGRLVGYTRFEVALEVPKEQADFVTVRIPLLLHAVNLRTFRTPLASGPDGQLPDIDMIRRVVMAAAPEAFGEGIVHRVAIIQAVPA